MSNARTWVGECADEHPSAPLLASQVAPTTFVPLRGRERIDPFLLREDQVGWYPWYHYKSWRCCARHRDLRSKAVEIEGWLSQVR